jgi:hypothetical protein
VTTEIHDPVRRTTVTRLSTLSKERVKTKDTNPLMPSRFLFLISVNGCLDKNLAEPLQVFRLECLFPAKTCNFRVNDLFYRIYNKIPGELVFS